MTAVVVLCAIEFNSALPVWMAAGLGAAAVASVLCFYWGQRDVAGTKAVRLLSLLRVLAVLCAMVMLVGPGGVWTSWRHSRGTLYLVLDDSRSMARLDPGQSQSRAALAEEAIGKLRATLDRFDVEFVGLSEAGSFASSDDRWFKAARDVLANPKATATAIGDALRRIADQSDAPATVVVISDGRQNRGALPEAVARRLASNGSRLFALRVGSREPVRDAAVDSVEAPSLVLAGDDVPVSASVRLDGIEEPVAVSLTRDGQAVTSKTIAPAPLTRVDFTDAGPGEGDHVYAVSVAPVANEATTRNNQLSAKVTVRREKIRVLLLEDEPRWEYQFLKGVLGVDRTVELKSRLLQPARIENIPAPVPEALPGSTEEWSRFDVVIVGDVAPATLTPGMHRALADALRQGKVKSLILIAGPRNMPGRYAGTPLATLVPVDLSRAAPNPVDLVRGFAPQFAPEAEKSTLARLVPDEQLNRALWSAVPSFYWHADHTTIKPAAQVVWQTAADSAGQAPLPVLATMAYGSGRVLYLASPQTWRLRYVQAPGGEAADLHRRFWYQAIRWAVAGEPARTDSEDDVEDLNQSADPALLDAVAKAGNGAAFDVTEAAKLGNALPNVDHVRDQTTRFGLFEDPENASTRYLHWAAYCVFVALISVEWIVRKRKGLV